MGNLMLDVDMVHLRERVLCLLWTDYVQEDLWLSGSPTWLCWQLLGDFDPVILPLWILIVICAKG